MQGSYDINNKLSYYLQDDSKNVLELTTFKFKLLQQEDKEIPGADELVESVFSSPEMEEYKPGNALCNSNSFCVAALQNGVVNGCLVADIDSSDQSIVLRLIAVDPDFQNKKIGSILLLILNDICLKLSIRTVSLIASEHGQLLYKSFGFKEMGHNSFAVQVPFDKRVLQKKLQDIRGLYTKISASENTASSTLFNHPKKNSTRKKKNITRKKPLEF